MVSISQNRCIVKKICIKLHTVLEKIKGSWRITGKDGFMENKKLKKGGTDMNNNPCNECACSIWSMQKKEMVCKEDKIFNGRCFITKYQKYMKDTKSTVVNRRVPLYVNGKKKDALIKEMRYIERTADYFHFSDAQKNEQWCPDYMQKNGKDEIAYDIEIDGESLLYHFAVKGADICLLVAYKDNNFYKENEKISIDITGYKYLLDLLWEISGYSEYGLLHCFADFHK